MKLRTLLLAALFAIAPAYAHAVEPAPYKWTLANAGGGSYTIGIHLHPRDASVRYLRMGDTGMYRWDDARQIWIQNANWTPDLRLTRLQAMALDPNDANVVYYAAGNDEVGDVFKSTDRGVTFAPSKIAGPGKEKVRITGMGEATRCGERLAVDPNNGNVIYFATRLDGLFRSDAASAPDSWKRVDAFTARGDIAKVEKRNPSAFGGLVFVAFDAGSGTVQRDGLAVTRTIYVGVHGDLHGATGVDEQGGVYRSTDGGATWTHLANPLLATKFPARAQVASDGTLYFTAGRRVAKLARGSDAIEVLTLPLGEKNYHAIAVDPRDPKHVVVSITGVANNETVYQPDKTGLFRSTDGGATWTTLDCTFANRTPWWHQANALTATLEFDPHKPGALWLGDWQDPYRADDVAAKVVHWRQIGEGHDGAYINSIAAPFTRAAGQAQLLVTGADYGGWRIDDMDVPPGPDKLTQNPRQNMGLGDGTSVSLCREDPNVVAAVGGFNHGLQGGGGISTDNGLTWTPFTGFGLRWDQWSNDIKLGQIVAGATKQSNGLPILVHNRRFHGIFVSSDGGNTWTKGEGVPAGTACSEWAADRALTADPIDGKTFYLFDPGISEDAKRAKQGVGRSYRSIDGGLTWQQTGSIAYSWKERQMQGYHLVAGGSTGDLWLTLRDPWSNDDPAEGLWHSTDGGATWTKAFGLGEPYCLALGAPAPGRSNPALYVAHKRDRVDRIWRSDDATSTPGDLSSATWTEIWNHDAAKYLAQPVARGLRLIEADKLRYGLLYIGTDSQGLYYGVPASENLRPWSRLVQPEQVSRRYEGNRPLDVVTIDAGKPFPLIAYGTDVDGAVAKVEFLVDGQVVATQTQRGEDGWYHAEWPNPVAGERVLSVRVTDDAGGATTSNVVRVDVK